MCMYHFKKVKLSRTKEAVRTLKKLEKYFEFCVCIIGKYWGHVALTPLVLLRGLYLVFFATLYIYIKHATYVEYYCGTIYDRL